MLKNNTYSLPVSIIFILSLMLSGWLVFKIEKNAYHNKRLDITAMSSSYATVISHNVYQTLSATYPLAALVRKQNGEVSGFKELAAQMLTYYGNAASLQLAPGGVITHIVPVKGNEAVLGHDVFKDHRRDNEAKLAIETRQITLAGPFELFQGGIGAVGRLPVFLPDAQGKEKFWGFASVLMRFPDVLNSAKLSQLSDQGVAYELSRVHPVSGQKQVITRSSAPVDADYIDIPLHMPNSLWSFRVSPVKGWFNPVSLLLEGSLGLLFSLLITLTAALVLRLKQNEQNLELTIQSRTLSLNENLRRLQLALKVAGQGWFEFNIKTQSMIISQELASLSGFQSTPIEMTLDQWLERIHSEDRKLFASKLQGMEARILPHTLEYRWQTEGDRWLWLRSICEIVEWEREKPLRLLGIQTDISSYKRSEQVLRVLAESGSTAGDDLLHRIVRELALAYGVRSAVITEIDVQDSHQANTLAVWVNGAYQDNFSYRLPGTPCEVVTLRGFCFYPTQVQIKYPHDKTLADLQADSYMGVVLLNERREALGVIAIIDDKPMPDYPEAHNLLNSLATRVEIELQRRQSMEQLKLLARVFSDTHEGIMITDAQTHIIDVNPALCQITGYKKEDMIGKTPWFFHSNETEKDIYSEMWPVLQQQGFWQGEVWNRKQTGEPYAEMILVSALKNPQDEITHFIALFSDITEIKKHQQTLELMAHFDMLTKLPNRVLLTDRFAMATAHSKRNSSLLAVGFLDLDNFKPVNDTYGHNTGDLLLIEVAERIKNNIRENDTVSRLGGDEFALLMGDIESTEHCEHLLLRILHALNQPYHIEDHTLIISASCGVTLYPQDNADIDTLLRHADQAMYQAKLNGRNNFHFFNTEEDLLEVEKQHRLQDIQRALTRNELCLYYQPKVNMKSGEVFGVEALIRWRHPDKGLVPPGEFLPVIEGTKLETDVGDWVVDQAVMQLREWGEMGLKIQVSVNISSNHLLSGQFYSTLDRILSQHPSVNSDAVQLEILESSSLGNLQSVSEVIKVCRNTLGVSIALDDFGTGYSSLAHLRNLPASTIKIDQTFVRDMLDDPSDFAIIDAVVGLADSFNRIVIAEGVESIEHGLMLLNMGCYQAQGYCIARPMPAADIPDWIKNYRPNDRWKRVNGQTMSPKDSKILFLKLALDHWVKSFEACLKSESGFLGHAPIMEKTKCHCGVWLKRAYQEKLFSEQWLSMLEQQHRVFHQMADEILASYLAGDISAARNKMPELAEIQLSIQCYVEQPG